MLSIIDWLDKFTGTITRRRPDDFDIPVAMFSLLIIIMDLFVYHLPGLYYL